MKFRSIAAPLRRTADGQMMFRHPSNEDALVLFDPTLRRDFDKSADAPPVIRYLGNSESEDRYGSIIVPRGGRLSNYRANPVFLWVHESNSLPIGKALNVNLTQRGLEFDIEYAVDILPFARTVYNLVRGGFLNGVSIGFIPLEAENYKATTIPTDGAENLRYIDWELMELSQAPVPANRDALKLAYDQGVIRESDLQYGLERLMHIPAAYEITYRSAATPRADSELSELSEVRLLAGRVALKRTTPTLTRAIPNLDPTQATEIATGLQDAAQAAWELAETGMDLYESMLNVDYAIGYDIRDYARGLVSNGMYTLDYSRWLLKYYFELDFVPVPDADEASEADGGREATLITRAKSALGDDGFSRTRFRPGMRAGAVLSRENKTRLEQIRALAEEVISSAEKAKDDEATTDERTSTSTQPEVVLSDEQLAEFRGLLGFGGARSASPETTPPPAVTEPPATRSDADDTNDIRRYARSILGL